MDGISPVGLNPSYLSAIQSTSQSQHHRHPGMEAAAKLLGMSESDLRTAMRGGQSLSQIASSKGISQDQLVSTIATAIQQANPSISADRAQMVATEMASRTPGAQGTGNPGGPSGPQDAGGLPPGPPPAGAAGATGDTDSDNETGETSGTSATDDTSSTNQVGGKHHHRHHAMAAAMQAAAKALGVTTDQLTSALKSGQSLSSLASSKGVSQDDLVKAMATALQGVDSSLSADQATQIATGLATATPQSQPWAPTMGSSSTFGITA